MARRDLYGKHTRDARDFGDIPVIKISHCSDEETRLREVNRTE